MSFSDTRPFLGPVFMEIESQNRKPSLSSTLRCAHLTSQRPTTKAVGLREHETNDAN